MQAIACEVLQMVHLGYKVPCQAQPLSGTNLLMQVWQQLGMQHCQQSSCTTLYCINLGLKHATLLVERKVWHLLTLCSVHNGSSTGSGYPVVVSLPESSDGTDARLGEEVHGQITQALLSDHYIRLVLNNLCTDLLDVFLLHLEQCSPAVKTNT